ncbi:AI-2E family transporter YdiK [Acerihabitans arboris]|uniref:AI-2E family transporter YdiK n=1 Tax=Acerihabitans arboris TaxID=2691583 RepID=A0A845SJ81_9GAMM|nr:AI-2E family transporter YdiK [Acerihabitans arboris]NDL63076.1 AI-2E family transporter YdiK [Acerihabitans arboris]
MDYPRQLLDLPRMLFSVTFIALMTLACFWVVQPFILGFAWASMVVIATWPLLIKIQGLLWGRRSLAVVVMTLLLVLLFVLPVSILISSVIDNSAPLVAWATQPNRLTLPTLHWLRDVPLVGHKLYSGWQTMISGGGGPLVTKIQPYIGQSATWLLSQVAQVGSFLIHCGLMILFSVLLYIRGERVALAVRHFAIRLGAERGDASVLLAAQAIRAVALGVVLTAIVQAVLGGIGLAVSGIPLATILTIVMFIMCIAQLGPLPILIPAMIWLYWSGDTTWGTVLLIWSCVVGTLDNILRPIFIRMGADLPILLVLCGVIGGLLAFGMIGLFIGPVVLAVSYRLIFAWVHEAPSPSEMHDPEKHLSDLSEL